MMATRRARSGAEAWTGAGRGAGFTLIFLAERGVRCKGIRRGGDAREAGYAGLCRAPAPRHSGQAGSKQGLARIRDVELFTPMAFG